MPRHDRAYGATLPTKRSRGGTPSKRSRTPKNTYAAKQHRRAGVVPPTDGRAVFGRKNKPNPKAKPQKPKRPKGGSK